VPDTAQRRFSAIFMAIFVISTRCTSEPRGAVRVCPRSTVLCVSTGVFAMILGSSQHACMRGDQHQSGVLEVSGRGEHSIARGLVHWSIWTMDRPAYKVLCSKA
jgi:hypothetical protein